MLDIREAQIEGDESHVALLKHHYQDIRVGDLDTTFYGKTALMFRLFVSSQQQILFLFPNKEFVRVWEKLEKGFIDALIGTHTVSQVATKFAYMQLPSAPELCIFFSPIGQEDIDAIICSL